MFRLRAIGFSLLAVAAAGSPALGHDARSLGDGRLSTEARADYLFSCRQWFDPNAPGARRTGAWLDGRTYYPDRKPTVAGAVTWPDARVAVTVDGDARIVSANNLPTHETGVFPIRPSDPAFAYDRNPNAIRAQDILLRLPRTPRVAPEPSCVPLGMIGFTLVGGALYNALDARGRDAPAHEILDACGGHPQRRGQYHYHDDAPCLPKGADANGHSVLVGYALDGFGIYGPKDVGGRTATNKDLDACHGHVGPVQWDGRVQVVYHYHMNDEYPYSIGCFRGTPVRLGGRPFRRPAPGN